jgi:Spy/CpxP family protein refolding chaperone
MQDQQSQPDQSQQQATEQGGGHHRGGWSKQDTGKRVQRLTKKLNLNSDQQAKVKSILDDQQKQFETIRQDSSMSKQDRRAKMMDLHKSSDDQIRAVLNPDQQQKFDQMRQKQMERMARHHHGDKQGDGTANPPSSPQQ